MLLTDNETKVDLLNNEAIAKTVVAMLREKPSRAVTIGVHGDWGAGKSSVLEMIEESLKSEPKVLCLKFNGWRFQGFEDAKIALVEGIVTGLIEKRSLATKAAEAVKDIVRRIEWLKVARHGGGLAFAAVTGAPSPDHIGLVLDGLNAIVADPLQLATKENLQKAVDGIEGSLKPASKNVPHEIEEFRKAFDKLLKKADVDQLVVLIDDLDRCLPDTAIETLEAVRLFVFTSKTAFVVAADEAMIEYAVRKHFPELPDTTGPRDYARNYLEKLIQVPIRIPALGETETRIYVTLLLVGAELPENHAGYLGLVAQAKQLLKTPWTSARLDADELKKALDETSAKKVEAALFLSEQIGPILANGTQGNPRQIKRFLNSLMLRHQTAIARGFGGAVNLPLLAKLMLAERFLSRLFDQIASAAARDKDGQCRELEQLEQEAARPKTSQQGKQQGLRITSLDQEAPPEKVKDTQDSVLLNEWLASDAVRAWALLSPKLAGEDLRPYLFVTKDRKDYFGATSVLGRLIAVVDKLMGSKLSVQSHDAEIKQLAAPEAGQVFQELRGRIMGSASFDAAPAGIDGLALLVRAHPALQANLLDMLDALPADRCGPWLASGWEGVIKDSDASARLEKLLTRWSSSKSQSLKMTATAALRTPRKGKA